MRQCPLCSRLYETTVDFCPQDGRVLLLPDPLLGRIVDNKYRIESLLGAGGQSSVYRAQHVHLHRPTAFKVIRRDALHDERQIERFSTEAQAIARLNHPNIVTIHDFGIAPDLGAYLVMELLEGRSLQRELSQRSRLPVAEAVDIARQVARAADVAHAAGIVHRDIKPDNIFLERQNDDQVVKILDFGVATLRTNGGTPSQRPETGPIGTPAYMAPEIWRSEPIDARTDIYAIGCVLYEMIAGLAPFMYTEERTFAEQHEREAPPPLANMAGDVPLEVEAIVLGAMAKSPDERFQSAGALITALDAVSAETARSDAARAASGGSARSYTTGEFTLPRRSNLPQHLTTFVGREREIAEVAASLGQSRLVTLTGPGGSGKTRLSLEVASRVLPEFLDGVWQVPLATLAEPALVPNTVASILGVHEDPRRTQLETLLDFLRSKRLLLVLDNCEHMVAACAEIVSAILRACPNVRVLATSQEPLGLFGESTNFVHPLAVPDPTAATAVDDLAQSESVRLFVDRARLSTPTFALSARNGPAVARICHRLDGIPLAIELAAARVRLLSVDQIDERLKDRFKLLTSGSRESEPRQRTLQATMDWSYDLLDADARLAFNRLSVFAGGFTLEAAESVCAGGDVDCDEVLYLLSNLVDKSLVLVDEHGASTRYRMLQTIRQYGGEQLRRSGEAADVRGRHRDFFLQFAERAEAELAGPDQDVWLTRLELEYDNLRAAIEWSRMDAATSDAFARLAAALSKFWRVRGHEREGRSVLEDVLADCAVCEPDIRAKALDGLGTLARMQSDYERAEACHAESLEVWRRLGDASRISSALNHLGIVAHWRGDMNRAESLHTESLGLSRKTGDRAEIALALKNLGIVARYRGDFERAIALFEESLAISRSLDDTWEIASTVNNLGVAVASRGDFQRASEYFTEHLQLNRKLGEKRGVAMALLNLGELAQLRGQGDRAAELLVESLTLSADLGDKRAIAYTLECFATLAVAQQRPDRALRLAGAASALRKAIHSPLSPAELDEFNRSVERARTGLDPADADACFRAGAALALDDAIDSALIISA